MDLITFTFDENSNIWREILLEVQRQNIVNKLLKTKSLLTMPSNAMVCLSTSSKLSRPIFEFSSKVKVMGYNLGYHLWIFLLYLTVRLMYNDFAPRLLRWYREQASLLILIIPMEIIILMVFYDLLNKQNHTYYSTNISK